MIAVGACVEMGHREGHEWWWSGRWMHDAADNDAEAIYEQSTPVGGNNGGMLAGRAKWTGKWRGEKNQG